MKWRSVNFPKLNVIRLNRAQVFSLCLIGLISSCTDVRLVGKQEQLGNAEGKGKLCVADPDEVKRWLKLMFVMDKSGSNVQSPGTDPGATKRAGNIQKFLEANRGKTDQQYGMIIFQDSGLNGSSARAYINDGDDFSPSFTENIDEALEATDRLRQERDDGGTPYKAALEMTMEAIRKDMEKFPEEESFYMVFFVSDGEPTDLGWPGVDENELDRKVVELINTNAGHVALSTGFYGGRKQEFEDRLARMAKLGGGKFINFDKSQDWDFNDLIVKPTFEPWQMKGNTLIVYNVNAGFCFDRSVDVDSDGDGLCDKDELRPELVTLGFNPANRFSVSDKNAGDGKNGYGDLFRWRELNPNTRDALKKCEDRSDEDHDFLTACEEAHIRNDTPSPGIPKNGDPKNPDTDKDDIIDGIETFVYAMIGMPYAMDSGNLEENYDGESDSPRRQIQQHRNPLIRDVQQPGYDVHLSPIVGGGQECYKYQQTVLPMYTTLAVPVGKALPGQEHKANENVISIHYLQARQSDPRGDEIVYRYSYQKLMNDETTRKRIVSNQALSFDDKSFKSYKFGKRKKD